MLVVVPLAGELKFYPFDGELSTFRVSFAAPAFLFFLLWLRKVPLLLAGFLTGCSVLFFRIVLDWTNGNHLTEGLYLHFPAFFYYVAYSLLFYFAKVEALYDQSLRLAFWAIVAEFITSMLELLLPLSYSGVNTALTLPVVGKVLMIAVIRSFFVLSFFFIIRLRQTEFMAEQQKEQNKQLLLLISNLYEELIHLAKSQQNAENITRNCYHLYKALNQELPFDKTQLKQDILAIAGQVHEIKKDNQRIYVSLARLISDGKLNDYMAAAELAEIIVQSQQKYARALKKTIQFKVAVEPRLPELHVYTVMSLANNLVANAVEAIRYSGLIQVIFRRCEDDLEMQVIDNGTGIPLKKRNLVFKPGYTTKYDQQGNPSTGMGLCYIRDLVHNLGGSIALETGVQEETMFIIRLPLKSLMRDD